MDYKSLLDHKKLIAYLNSIAFKEKNSIIGTAANEITFHLQGNNDIPKKHYYNDLYRKYKFKLEVTRTNEGLQANLYSFVGEKINYVGVVYKNKNINPNLPQSSIISSKFKKEKYSTTQT